MEFQEKEERGVERTEGKCHVSTRYNSCDRCVIIDKMFRVPIPSLWRHRDKDADMFDKLESNTSSSLSETARASRDKLSSSVRCGRQRDGLLIGS